jgi:CRISPR-associated protein Csy1
MDEFGYKFSSWQEVIVNFFENKIAESSIYKARKYIIENQKKVESERDEEKCKKLEQKINEKKIELVKLREQAPKTEISEWLDETSKKKILLGERIIKATHILKFSHSSSTADGIFLAEKRQDHLLTTAAIKKDSPFDMAHNNGNLISISRFFSLKHEGEIVIDLILEGKQDFLRPFASNEQQLNAWLSGFRGLVEQRDIKTADKAKQVYFPVENNVKSYHLLVPLFSSTIAEEIYTVIADVKYGEESSKVRKAIGQNEDNPKYHSKPLVNYPHLAVQKFGGAQPQNVSMLNKGRMWKADPEDDKAWGITYLFTSAPPTWQSQAKPPIYSSSFFNNQLRGVVSKSDLDYLREFLIRFDTIDLSIKHPERKKWIDAWVGRIVDDVLAYAANIQAMEAGWSVTEGIRLKREHQLFLDPYRDDEAFQTERKANDWQATICVDFARWLNKGLVGKEKQFSPQQEHTRMWTALMEDPLREYDELIRMKIKTGRANA